MASASSLLSPAPTSSSWICGAAGPFDDAAGFAAAVEGLALGSGGYLAGGFLTSSFFGDTTVSSFIPTSATSVLVSSSAAGFF